MGRKRQSNPLDLPDRVYPKHGAFYYVHRDGRWEKLGTDVGEAKTKGRLYNDPDSRFGTMAYYLDLFIVHCEGRVGVKDLAQRTYDDYKGYVETLKVYFDRMTPAQIEPKHIGNYLDLGLKAGRGVSVNREKACLSACFSWLIRNGEGTVKTNPCFRVSGITRNAETPRDVYVEDTHYAAAWKLATRQVRGTMGLIYRTLQRPSDVLSWTKANLVTKRTAGQAEQRLIQTRQNKTGKLLEIAISPEIDQILAELQQDKRKVTGMTLIHNRSAQAYTEEGISSMLRRYIKQTECPYTWGFMDLRGKGASDMLDAGVPIEQISELMGHASVTTTEIYIKNRRRQVVTPNQVQMRA